MVVAVVVGLAAVAAGCTAKAFDLTAAEVEAEAVPLDLTEDGQPETCSLAAVAVAGNSVHVAVDLLQALKKFESFEHFDFERWRKY